jgi:Mg-chelatase subunit ChlD
VSYNAANGRTTVVVQFVARGRDGAPYSADDVTVEMLVDDQAIDNESVLQTTSQELSASLHYGLVLDASYSMLLHNPPAFEPMKTAARRSLEAGTALWTNRAGAFTWDLCWFNDFLFHRQGEWLPTDVEFIPAPPPNAATKLYAAVDFMARQMAETTEASGPRDQKVMVVLSDGADNLSNFDNSSVLPISGSTVSGAAFDRFGYQATTLDDAIASVRAVPNLTVHVLAMGSEFNAEDLKLLKKLAQAGNGQFLENPSSSGIDQLFDRVTQEFSTLQTVGAAIPQPSGEHRFKLVVKGTTFKGQTSYQFRYRAGPDGKVLK